MIIRTCQNSKSGWNSGDLDVAFQLFQCGMVWDGAVASKSSRDHLVTNGYAVRYQGVQAMTGKGTVAFLLSRAVWASAFRRWRLWRKNPLIVSDAAVKRAMR